EVLQGLRVVPQGIGDPPHGETALPLEPDIPAGGCQGVGALAVGQCQVVVLHGYGLPSLVFQNRSDPQILNDHSVFDPQAAVVGRYERLLKKETASVRWFFSLKDRRMLSYPLPWQIMSPFHVISSLRYLYDYATPVWGAGSGRQNFRATLTRFWHARSAS